MMKFPSVVCCMTLLVASVATAQSPQADLTRIRGTVGYQSALDHLDEDYGRFVRELIHLTEIPAPPFGEVTRATAYLDMLARRGPGRRRNG